MAIIGTHSADAMRSSRGSKIGIGTSRILRETSGCYFHSDPPKSRPWPHSSDEPLGLTHSSTEKRRSRRLHIGKAAIVDEDGFTLVTRG